MGIRLRAFRWHWISRGTEMNAFAQVKALGLHLLVAAASCALVACSGGGSLDQTPKGALSPAQVTTPANLDGLVTAAYSWLRNDHYTHPNFFWPPGNIRAAPGRATSITTMR